MRDQCEKERQENITLIEFVGPLISSTKAKHTKNDSFLVKENRTRTRQGECQ